MTLVDLRRLVRLYTRDENSYLFSDKTIQLFLNEAINRIKQYKIFEGMVKLVLDDDEPVLLPERYHHMLALYASSRCFENDQRFYEAVERRNEFESLLEGLISEIQAGNIVITKIVDGEKVVVEDTTNCLDAIKDVYFTRGVKDSETFL